VGFVTYSSVHVWPFSAQHVSFLALRPCAITGPLFLIGGIMLLLSGVRMIHFDTRWVWPVLLAGIGVAFVLEWLYGKRPAP
jgi:hypothetical protein